MNEYKNYSISKELCNDCGISQKDKNGEFMYCSKCDKFICYDCIKKHKGHNLFSIDKYDSLCKKHFYIYSFYCFDCQKNICPLCYKEHEKHDIIYLTELKCSEDTKINLINDINNLKKEIDNFNLVISLFNKLKEQIELEINFMKFLLNIYEYKENHKNLHYNIYQNLNICKKQFDINNNEHRKFFNQTNEFLQSLKNFLLIYTNEIINKGYRYFSPCNNDYFQINISKKIAIKLICYF